MFTWDDKYSVNIKVIDEQHKHLFKLGKDIFELAEVNDNYDHYDEIMSIIKELKDYTKYHFKFEEDLLFNYGVKAQKYAIHKLEHRSFINKVFNINPDEVDYRQKETIIKLLDFIERWITQHILETDVEYMKMLNQKGIY